MINALRLFGILVAAIAPSMVMADAKVYSCPLTPKGDVTEAELRVFEFDGVAHSAFVQLTTNYGDTLPYVFVCNIKCGMSFVDDEFSYELKFDAALAEGSDVSLTSSSSLDEHEFIDEFTLQSCAIQTRESR